MNILITGSAGFIGRHLTKYLSNQGHVIVEFDRKDEFEVMDITNLSGVDCVIHLAAQTSVWNEDIDQIEEDNIKVFMHIFRLCKKLDIRFIYASSSCAVNISSMYGISKEFDEEFAYIYGWDKCVGLRLHNVYGPNPRPDTLLNACMKEEVTLWNKGNNYRHFTYIDDVCRCFEQALTLESGLYNVYNPELNTTKTFAEEVSKYKPLKIILRKDVKKYDKVNQLVNPSIVNLLEEDYTNIQSGIKKIFEK